MPDVKVCSVSDVEPNSAKRVDTDGYRLAVVRLVPEGGDERWFVIDDRCSHAEASLAEGDVWADDCEIECPLHGSVFNLESGKALTLPATQPQGTYGVRVEDDDVIAELP